jgi:putative hydrolase of the HAD superfamily
MPRALLFDLDETLVLDERVAVESFAATARVAAERRPLDGGRLARDARERARELWHAAPNHAYCARIGMSSWEGLWCRFEGDSTELRALAEWARGYRRDAWRLALSDQGIEESSLAEELGERFGRERRERHELFDDVGPTLDALGDEWSLAILTNGASCLQREKLAGAGLIDRFAVVVASGDLGVGKPAEAIFAWTLRLLGVDRSQAVMVGDSYANDVEGARAAGLRAVWLDRGRVGGGEGQRIESLAQLPAVLAAAR